MATSKNCYLLMGDYKSGGREESTRDVFFYLKGMRKLLASGIGPPSTKNPGLCCLFVSLKDLHTFVFFGLSPRRKLATKHKKESHFSQNGSLVRMFVRML